MVSQKIRLEIERTVKGTVGLNPTPSATLAYTWQSVRRAGSIQRLSRKFGACLLGVVKIKEGKSNQWKKDICPKDHPGVARGEVLRLYNLVDMPGCRAPKEQGRTEDDDKPRGKVTAMSNKRRHSETQARIPYFVLERTVGPSNKCSAGFGEYRMHHEVVEVHEPHRIEDVIRKQFVSDCCFRHRPGPAKQ